MFGVAVDVDQYIDLIACDLACGGFIGECTDLSPASTTTLHSDLRRVLNHGIATVIGVDFDARLVVQFQHFSQCKTDGVIAQVR